MHAHTPGPRSPAGPLTLGCPLVAPTHPARAQLCAPHLPRRLRLGVRAPDPHLPCRAGAPPHACASSLPGGPRGAEARHVVVAAPRTRGPDGRRWRVGRRCARCGPEASRSHRWDFRNARRVGPGGGRFPQSPLLQGDVFPSLPFSTRSSVARRASCA